MALTRAGIEGELVARLRGKLVNRFWTLSVLTNGSNPDLNGPIRRALRSLGGDTADPLTVADADLAVLTGLQIERLLDFAKLETLKVCMGQAIECDVETGEDRQYLSQVQAQLQAEIAYAEQRLSEPMGALMPVISTASMTGSRGIPNDPFDPCRTRSSYGRWPYP